jgi:hypothetical protein
MVYRVADALARVLRRSKLALSVRPYRWAVAVIAEAMRRRHGDPIYVPSVVEGIVLERHRLE